MATLDILLITNNRLEYLKKSLPTILSQTADFRLIIWDNASDKETVEYLKRFQDKALILFSKYNESLADVTSKVFLISQAEFVGKVDPDILFPPNWAERILQIHSKAHLGFVGGIHFYPEDYSDVKPIISDGVWKKHHIGGNFIIRRKDFKGYAGDKVMGLSEYQAEMGLPNGYIMDLWIEHMEDERSKHYINTKEYQDYKKNCRGVSLDVYQTGIANKEYLHENSILR